MFPSDPDLPSYSGSSRSDDTSESNSELPDGPPDDPPDPTESWHLVRDWDDDGGNVDPIPKLELRSKANAMVRLLRSFVYLLRRLLK